MSQSDNSLFFRTEIFKTLKGVDEALSLIKLSVKDIVLDCIEIDVKNSLHYFPAEDILAQQDVPNFDRSAVDGYAVISNDVIGSSPTNPIVLKVVQKIYADTNFDILKPINHGEASIVYTGAPLPPNADAVVMFEDTKFDGLMVQVFRPVSPYQNVSRKGEDFSKGSIVVEKGTLIRPWHLAALLSTGLDKIRVYRRIKVGVLSTGSELTEKYNVSGIVNTTKPLLLSLVSEEFCEAKDFGTVPDDREAIREKILQALPEVDILLTTGGTSVGATDLVSDAILSIKGSKLIFHGVRVRPGRPTGMALVNGKPVFMLSGYPVASFTGFEVFVKYTINLLRSSRQLDYPKIRARLSRRLAKPVGVKAYVRVKVFKVGEEYVAEPLRLTGSGLLSTLTRGNALLVIDENVEGYDEGEVVEVQLIGGVV
ncbi:MAG: molybdopterin molybdotransferase MoeA [Nitrososphaeria archaeon]|nr:molybdopterin molybdotransferase MoeA [Nitrososphaeria archaeon]